MVVRGRVVLTLLFLLPALAVHLEAAPGFLRGDVDQSSEIDISDPIGTLGSLFLGGPSPECLDSADANDDGTVNLSDALYSLRFLFNGGTAPPAPFPRCGVDPTADQLGCASYGASSCVAIEEPVDAFAPSNHYVLVTYDEPVFGTLLDPASYEIRTTDGRTLGILSAGEDPSDPRRVLLATQSQQPVAYTLSRSSPTTKSTQGNTKAAQGSIIFQGSDDAEPFLVSAISLGSTDTEGQVLLTFSEPMEEGVEDARFYQISAPDLEIRSVELSEIGSEGTTAILTTEPQQNLPYTVKVTNVKSAAGDFVVDPTRSTATFFGIPPVDTVPPQLTNSTATNDTTVVLSFSEPLDPEWIDPQYFTITCFDPYSGTACADLTVTDAQLSTLGTQVILTTLPQVPGLEYTVQVQGVQDIQENPIDPTASIQTFIAPDSDPPFLASAISLGSTPVEGSVLLTFSEPLDAATAQVAVYYSIRNPDLDITDAQLSADGLRVTLTTEPQAHADYTVIVTNVRSRGGEFLIDPTRSSQTFRGVAPVDNAAPQVTRAQSVNSTSVLVSFNEPMAAEVADPGNYVVTPDLVVTGAERSEFGTQVLLTTLPQTAGTTYTVEVAGVTDLAGNPIDPAESSETFTFQGISTTGNGEAPKVIGAVSTSNTTVHVVFSEPMSSSVLNRSAYVIVQENVNPEVGALQIVERCVGGPKDGVLCDDISDCTGGICEGIRFVDPEQTTVELQTLSQNEVTYTLNVVGVTDLEGNPLIRSEVIAPGIVIKLNTVSFPGTPAGGATIVHSDDDNLSDSEEQRGYVVRIQTVDGEIVEWEVTSDPFLTDTDGDGLDDALEKSLRLDPRDPDTDDDLLSDEFEFNVSFSEPRLQDTDGDGLDDGLEFTFFKTSPNFSDTDGDQIEDGDEILVASRDPRIADLPKPQLEIGAVSLVLDRRFEYTDEEGTSSTDTTQVTSTLTQSDEQTFATADEDTTTTTIEATTGLEISAEFPSGGGVTGSFELSAGYEQGHTSSFSESSTEAAEEAYEDSFTLEQTVDFSQSVTETVEDAQVRFEVTVRNGGTTAFTISNLQLTALQPDPQDHTKFVPVAALVPEAGDDLALNLGPLGLVSERGPLSFVAIEVFPSQVEDLLKNPKGLVTKWANFDITDELGRNFAFTSQEVFDRTAGISIDLGDGRLESYRVATSSTFDPSGRPVGITMGYALQDILRFGRNDVIREPQELADSTGLPDNDGVVSTAANAMSDDVQVVPVGGSVDPGQIIITAGPDGILQTTPSGDDRVGGSGYEVTIVDRDYNGAMIQVAILTRMRDVQSGFLDDPLTPPLGTVTERVVDETNTFWVVYSSRDLNPTVDFEDMVLNSGDDYSLAFVQDKDKDGVFAREEYLYGSSDKNPNTDGCPDDDLSTPEQDGTCTEGTFDTLTDFEEIREGWTVQVERQLPRQVYPDPTEPDSDGDQLLDHEERDCELDPRDRDTDRDGISDYDEIAGYDISEPDGSGVLIAVVPRYAGQVVMDGGNGIVETTANTNDTQAEAVNSTVTPGAIIITAGSDGTLDTTTANDLSTEGDDFIAVRHDVVSTCTPGTFTDALFGSDPLNADTDGDGIEDGAEVALGINPNNPFDAGRFRDADSDGVPDAFEEEGFETYINGNLVRVFSNPFDPDTDNDRLPDLLEHMLGSNPGFAYDTDGDRVPDRDADGADTDEDGLGDFDEFDAGDTCAVEGQATPSVPCVQFRSKSVCTSVRSPETETSTGGGCTWQDFLDTCSTLSTCFFDESVLDSFGSLRVGTNLNEADTDGDGLTDAEELVPYSITINGASQAVEVCGGTTTSGCLSPFDPDSDDDGWSDSEEQDEGTNPGIADSDGDGTNDPDEDDVCVTGGTCRDPTVDDQKITITYTTIEILGDCDALDNKGDFTFSVRYKLPGGSSFTQLASHSTIFSDCGNNDNEGCLNEDGWLWVDDTYTVNISQSVSFIAEFGETFELAGFVSEVEGDSADASLSYGPAGCVCDFLADAPDVTTDTSFTVGSISNTSPSWSESGNCGNIGDQSYTWTIYATITEE